MSPTSYSPKGLEALSPNRGGFSPKWNSASGFLNKLLSFKIHPPSYIFIVFNHPPNI